MAGRVRDSYESHRLHVSMSPPIPSAPRASRADTVRFVIAGAVLITAQFALALSLRNFNFFNDDLEHVAYGRFFSSLYKRQFDVHMPLGALLSFLWGHAFGFSASLNRALAAALNSGILLTLLLLGRRAFSLAAGFIGAVAYLLLEVPLWAYLHLSEVPSVLFMLLGTVAILRLESNLQLQGPARARLALGVGALFGLAFMARLLAVELFALVVLVVTVGRVVGRSPGTPWLKLLALDAVWVSLGAVLPLLAFVGIFAAMGTLNDFIYWTLLHNMKAKTYVDPAGWIGHLNEPAIRALWRFALCALAVSIVSYAVYWRRQERTSRVALWLAWAGAIGGWVGANPSGIGQLAFHAIPAFPFLGLAAGAGTVGLVRQALASQRSRKLIAGALAMLAALAVIGVGNSLWLPLTMTWKLARQFPVMGEFAWSEQVGRYIRDNSRPEDTLFIFGTWPLLYATSERNSATTFSIVFMDLVHYEEEMLAQLRAAPPRFVVLNPKDFWFSHNVHALPRVRDYLLENYRVSTAFPELLEPRTPENEQRVFRHPEISAAVAQPAP
ncbi:hypothetical protein [Hyalangium versicolor]|uniref:hypothetical protein n=1 Tax=Hyalangium versicolor TaxID=2861190 RepID=UPI001CCA51F0|nr:hypothetical protein [Hyalangium versicolor]